MYLVHQTDEFKTWLCNLDKPVRARIDARLRRVETQGHFGDCKTLGQGLAEMRIHFGPGYRLYFMQLSNVVVLMLGGGDKSTQQGDIQRAQQLAKTLGDL